MGPRMDLVQKRLFSFTNGKQRCPLHVFLALSEGFYIMFLIFPHATDETAKMPARPFRRLLFATHGYISDIRGNVEPTDIQELIHWAQSW